MFHTFLHIWNIFSTKAHKTWTSYNSKLCQTVMSALLLSVVFVKIGNCFLFAKRIVVKFQPLFFCAGISILIFIFGPKQFIRHLIVSVVYVLSGVFWLCDYCLLSVAFHLTKWNVLMLSHWHFDFFSFKFLQEAASIRDLCVCMKLHVIWASHVKRWTRGGYEKREKQNEREEKEKKISNSNNLLTLPIIIGRY